MGFMAHASSLFPSVGLLSPPLALTLATHMSIAKLQRRQLRFQISNTMLILPIMEDPAKEIYVCRYDLRLKQIA